MKKVFIVMIGLLVFFVGLNYYAGTLNLNLFKSSNAGKAIESVLPQEPIVANSVPIGSKTVFVYANGNKVMKINNDDSFHYLHGDHLSSERVITNSNGVVEASFDSYPFGATLAEIGVSDEYKYTGKELDDTGLYYYGARYYDAKIGRFVSVDPVLELEQSPYKYVSNNPLGIIDPTGMVEVLPPGFVGPPAPGQIYFEEVQQAVQPVEILGEHSIYELDLSPDGRFENPDALVNKPNNVKQENILLDYTVIYRDPKYQEYLKAHGITETQNAEGIYEFTDRAGNKLSSYEVFTLLRQAYFADFRHLSYQTENSKQQSTLNLRLGTEFINRGIVPLGERSFLRGPGPVALKVLDKKTGETFEIMIPRSENNPPLKSYSDLFDHGWPNTVEEYLQGMKEFKKIQ